MKIGIFDSGLGGLIIAHSLMKALPQYDYMYVGDTARVPYGGRSQTVIYQFTEQAVDFLLGQDCQLVIIACNSASAEALRRIQQAYMPAHYLDRRVVGVLIPSAEATVAATQNGRVGVIATQATVNSEVFIREIHKLKPDVQVFQQAAPLLVPLVENNGLAYADPILRDYLRPLLQKNIDTLVLGCTHYPFLKQQIQQQVGEQVRLISQDEVVPPKLADYLQRHPEIEQQLSRDGSRQFLVTDRAASTQQMATQLFGGDSAPLELLQF